MPRTRGRPLKLPKAAGVAITALLVASPVTSCREAQPPESTVRVAQTAPEAQCRTESPARDGIAGTARIRGTLCDIVAVPVATLRGSADGSRPDPGSRLVMSSDGRYFTTSAYAQQIIEWDASGRFVRAVGATGEGPGEFSPRGGLLLFMDRADSLFVRDGSGRWTVFDSGLVYARTFPDNGSGSSAASITILPHVILSTAPAAGNARPFRGIARDGETASDLGDASHAQGVRLMAIEGDTALWTTPPNGEPQGLSLDRWTVAGSRIATIRRPAAWLPDDGFGGVDATAGPDLPEYDMLHRTPDGMLWVTVVVRDSRWRAVDGSEVRALERELYDARMEVIDPWSGSVKASFRYDGPPDPIPPFSRFLPGTRRSYRLVRDSATGLSRMEIFDVYLAQRQ